MWEYSEKSPDHSGPLISDFQPLDYEKEISVFYKPLSLWYFVIVAQTDQDKCKASQKRQTKVKMVSYSLSFIHFFPGIYILNSFSLKARQPCLYCLLFFQGNKNLSFPLRAPDSSGSARYTDQLLGRLVPPGAAEKRSRSYLLEKVLHSPQTRTYSEVMCWITVTYYEKKETTTLMPLSWGWPSCKWTSEWQLNWSRGATGQPDN